MTSHKLVRWTLDQIAQQFNASVVGTDAPRLVDEEDGTVFEIEQGLTAIGDYRVGQQSRAAGDLDSAVGTAQVGTATPGFIPGYQDATGNAVVGDAIVGTTLGGRRRIGRETSIDLTNGASVTVSPSPDRSEEPIGTEYDLRVEDGVELLIEGVHVDEFGDIDDSETFESLVNEIKRAVLKGRRNPLTNVASGEVAYHTVVPQNSARPPTNTQTDYFAASFELRFRGYQEL